MEGASDIKRICGSAMAQPRLKPSLNDSFKVAKVREIMTRVMQDVLSGMTGLPTIFNYPFKAYNPHLHHSRQDLLGRRGWQVDQRDIGHDKPGD